MKAKAKAKPAKGSARVKKFDRGGTIGALAGLGTLAYLLSRKKDEDKVTGDVIKPLKESADTEDTGEYKAQGKFPQEAGDGTSQGGPAEKETVAPVRRAPAVKGTIGKTSAKPVARAKATDKVGAGYENLTTLPKFTPNEERPSKPYPTGAKGTEKDPYLRGMGPKNTFLTEKRLAEAKKAMKGSWDMGLFERGNLGIGKKAGGKVKKYAEGGVTTTTPPAPKKKEPTGMELEVENAKKDARVKKEAAGAEKEVKRNMSTFGFKKGGAVSASRRADGIAQKGKTRGKMY